MGKEETGRVNFSGGVKEAGDSRTVWISMTKVELWTRRLHSGDAPDVKKRGHVVHLASDPLIWIKTNTSDPTPLANKIRVDG